MVRAENIDRNLYQLLSTEIAKTYLICLKNGRYLFQLGKHKSSPLQQPIRIQNDLIEMVTGRSSA